MHDRFCDGKLQCPAFCSYSDKHLIETDHCVVVDVKTARAMLNRAKVKFDLHPEQLIADAAYGTGPLRGCLVDRKIAPLIPVFDKSARKNGTWTRADFEWDAKNDRYTCPEGHALKQFRRNHSDPNRRPIGKVPLAIGL